MKTYAELNLLLVFSFLLFFGFRQIFEILKITFLEKFWLRLGQALLLATLLLPLISIWIPRQDLLKPINHVWSQSQDLIQFLGATAPRVNIVPATPSLRVFSWSCIVCVFIGFFLLCVG